MGALIDTTLLIDCKKGSAQTRSFLDLFISENLPIYTSIICVMEFLRNSKDKEEFQKSQKSLRDLVRIIHINESISNMSHYLFCQFHLSHHIDIADSLIAATAVVYNLKLITTNQKHFSMIKGLKIEKPY